MPVGREKNGGRFKHGSSWPNELERQTKNSGNSGWVGPIVRFRLYTVGDQSLVSCHLQAWRVARCLSGVA